MCWRWRRNEWGGHDDGCAMDLTGRWVCGLPWGVGVFVRHGGGFDGGEPLASAASCARWKQKSHPIAAFSRPTGRHFVDNFSGQHTGQFARAIGHVIFFAASAGCDESRRAGAMECRRSNLLVIVWFVRARVFHAIRVAAENGFSQIPQSFMFIFDLGFWNCGHAARAVGGIAPHFFTDASVHHGWARIAGAPFWQS